MSGRDGRSAYPVPNKRRDSQRVGRQHGFAIHESTTASSDSISSSSDMPSVYVNTTAKDPAARYSHTFSVYDGSIVNKKFQANDDQVAFQHPGELTQQGNVRISMDKLKEDQTAHQQLQKIRNRFDRASLDATNSERMGLLQEDGEIIELISSLQEANGENENIIRDLKLQLAEVTIERNAVIKDNQEKSNQISAQNRMGRENKVQKEKMFRGEAEESFQLVSILQQTNRQNEETIRDLQRQLNVGMDDEETRIDDNPERLAKILAGHRLQWGDEARQERARFVEDIRHQHEAEIEEMKVYHRLHWEDEARQERSRLIEDMSHKQEAEIEEWKLKVNDLEGKCQNMESELKENEERMDEIETDCNTRLQQLQSRGESMAAEVRLWKDMYEEVRNLNNELIEELDHLGNDNSRSSNASREANQESRLADIESTYNSKLQELQSHNEALKEEVGDWKKQHKSMEETMAHINGLNAIPEVDETKLAEIESDYNTRIQELEYHNEATKAEVTDLKDLNDNLVEKLGDLSDENGRLLAKYQKLEQGLQLDIASTTNRLSRIAEPPFENNLGNSRPKYDKLRASFRASLAENISVTHMTKMERKEALETIEDMELENDALHQSMEEAMQLAQGMSEKMATFVQAHEETVKGYEEKLASLKSDLKKAASSEEEVSTAMHDLKEEIKTLQAQLKEVNDSRDKCEQGQEDAQHRCHVLQQEIDQLRQALNKLKENNDARETLDQRSSLEDNEGEPTKRDNAEHPWRGLGSRSSASGEDVRSSASGKDRSTRDTLESLHNSSILEEYGAYGRSGIVSDPFASAAAAIAAEAKRESRSLMRARMYVSKR